MNILITGGCGFIGSNFINFIFDKININKLVNLDAMYYCAKEEHIKENIRNSDRYVLFKGNTSNSDIVNHILKSYSIDYVVNFAAQSHVCTSFTNPIQYTRDNILGTHILLDCCYKYHTKFNKIKKFIHISTDEVYGESQVYDSDTDKKTENTILCPTNPYSATKAGAELIVQSYYHSFNFPIIITRSNNIYGDNQYTEKLIPRFIDLLKNNKKLTIHGRGDNVRAFLHVNDLCEAFKLILTKGVIGEIYNIGSEDEYTVLEVADILIKKIKKTEKTEDYIEYIDDRPFNDKRYWISDTKIKELGWLIEKKFSDELDNLITSR